MKPIEPWHIVVSNLVLLAMALIVRRWHKEFLLGLYGLAIIVLSTVESYLTGRSSIWWTLNVLFAVLLLCADLRDKLPHRDDIRKRVFRDKNATR